jgi:SlyX protein
MVDQTARIEDLETRVAHQEKAISDLNEMVLAQWRKIEALERQVTRLGNEMQDVSAASVPVDRPPHY